MQFDPKDFSTLTHPYSLSKTLQVLIAQSWEVLYNMHIVIAKPSNLIGPGFSNGVCSIFAKKIIDMEKNKAEKILQVTNLNAQRDFLDVRDAVSAYDMLLIQGNSGETYEIASGTSRSLGEVTHCFKSLAKMEFEIISLTTGGKEQQIKILSSKLRNLGWKPTIPFESSLRDMLNFYRKNEKIRIRRMEKTYGKSINYYPVL
ncbi:NAD-dependent epimerase/dehydratase family protein [Peribacillus frigoritolerans]|uniref:NAD-dependent epimerase/dehydratase family protein n=1 Tax=Peribacillus frigoritolerans TaxID=450367 RepID=UPI0038135200